MGPGRTPRLLGLLENIRSENPPIRSQILDIRPDFYDFGYFGPDIGKKIRVFGSEFSKMSTARSENPVIRSKNPVSNPKSPLIRNFRLSKFLDRI